MAIGVPSMELASRSLADELRRLLDESAPAHNRPRCVEVVETHISWVFLTERFAYKLKKPVKFEFLDFSTVELRRQACQAEVQLNRRLAGTVYLEALPLSRAANGDLELSASDEPIDWVVKMRRLPADKSLARLLSSHRLSARQAENIAEHLSRFYSSLPPALVKADVYCQGLVRHTNSNASALWEMFPEARLAIGSQVRYLALKSEDFAARVVAGRIVDGHGDLRPEHIYAEDPPVVIDCIEFSDEFRRVDVADELAFLDMECQRLGDGDFGKLVLAKYQHMSGEAIPPAVASFYRGYRACVRAKVAFIRSTQQSDDAPVDSVQSVREYLDLANQYAAALGPPALIIVGGLPGTGKSTLARKISANLGCELLSTDRVRRELLRPNATPAEYGQGRYEIGARQEVYADLLHQAARALSNGLSLVLDGTFNSRELRRRAFDIAGERKAVAFYVHCQCPRQVALQRIMKRAQDDWSASETRPEFFEQQVRDFEAPGEGSNCVAVETTSPLSDQLQVVRQELTRRLFP